MGTTSVLTASFAALADDTRRDIVARLATDGDASVTELAAAYDMSLQAVSKHVGVLGDAGLVSRRRDGRHRPVSLEADAMVEVTRWLEGRRREAEARHRRLDDVLDQLATDRVGDDDPDPDDGQPDPDDGQEHP